MTVTFDLTAANTSWLGGLGKKLKELCKAAWEEDNKMFLQKGHHACVDLAKSNTGCFVLIHTNLPQGSTEQPISASMPPKTTTNTTTAFT